MPSDEEVELFGGKAVVGDRPDVVHVFLTGELCGHPERYIDMVEGSEMEIEDYDAFITEMGKRNDVTTAATMTPEEAVDVASHLLRYAHSTAQRGKTGWSDA